MSSEYERESNAYKFKIHALWNILPWFAAAFLNQRMRSWQWKMMKELCANKVDQWINQHYFAKCLRTGLLSSIIWGICKIWHNFAVVFIPKIYHHVNSYLSVVVFCKEHPVGPPLFYILIGPNAARVESFAEGNIAKPEQTWDPDLQNEAYQLQLKQSDHRATLALLRGQAGYNILVAHYNFPILWTKAWSLTNLCKSLPNWNHKKST